MSERGGKQPRSGDAKRSNGGVVVEHDRSIPVRQLGERSQPLRDPMAYVRYEREEANAQIQRSLRAWRKPDSGNAAAGDADKHAVSQPGEPAELEADAVADRVAGELHGAGGADEQQAPKPR